MEEQRIPKIIMQTAKTEMKPNRFRSYFAEHFPDYEYIFFTDEDILRFFDENYMEEFKDIKEVFTSFSKGEHRADLFRYYFLYCKGGIYLDTDAIILSNFQELIDLGKEIYISEPISNCCINAIMTVEKNSAIMYEAIVATYTTNPKILETNYLKLCCDLYKIIQDKDVTILNQKPEDTIIGTCTYYLPNGKCCAKHNHLTKCVKELGTSYDDVVNAPNNILKSVNECLEFFL